MKLKIVTVIGLGTWLSPVISVAAPPVAPPSPSPMPAHHAIVRHREPTSHKSTVTNVVRYANLGDMPSNGRVYQFALGQTLLSSAGVKYAWIASSTGDGAELIKAYVSVALVVETHRNGIHFDNMLVFVESQQTDGPTIVKLKSIDLSEVSEFALRFDDALRIGRQWRSEGCQPAKKVDFTPADDFSVSIWRNDGEAVQNWSVTVKDVTFTSSSLEQLALLDAEVDQLAAWLTHHSIPEIKG